jgi:S1-C subfamily serine protease
MLTYSSGTGFFVSREGYIITNYHVIKNCSDINVSGSVPLSAAKLVAQDIGYDLALLKTRAMAIDEATVRKVAHLARIALPEAGVAPMARAGSV